MVVVVVVVEAIERLELVLLKSIQVVTSNSSKSFVEENSQSSTWSDGLVP